MRVLCGGEDGVMGVYGGILLPDVRREAENRLVRVDAIYVYPRQRAIITHSVFERLPLPWGAEVRIRILGQDGRPGAKDEQEYDDMLEIAHRRLMSDMMNEGDWEVYRLLKHRRALVTGVSGCYCRI